jgi:anti-anti-sigma factor
MTDDPENRPLRQMPPQLQTTVTTSQETAVLDVTGEIDATTAEELGSAIAGAFLHVSRLVVDLGAVSFMDSTGISVIMRELQDESRPPGAIVLRDPGPQVRRLLAITNLDQIVSIEDGELSNTPASVPPVRRTNDDLSSGIGSASDLRPGSTVEVTIRNLARGQVIEVALSERIDELDWTALEARLRSLIAVRQPAELRLDPDGVGATHCFTAGLGSIAEALAEFGGRLTLPPPPDQDQRGTRLRGSVPGQTGE